MTVYSTCITFVDTVVCCAIVYFETENKYSEPTVQILCKLAGRMLKKTGLDLCVFFFAVCLWLLLYAHVYELFCQVIFGFKKQVILSFLFFFFFEMK